MTSSINYKFSNMTKTLATDITFTWFLSGMNSLMKCKERAGTEDSSTKLHFYAFSPIGTAWCGVKDDCAIKRLSQLLHLSGFSPVWILPWTAQLEVWLKSFPHTHLQSFSPVWYLWWTANFAVWLKPLPHRTLLWVGFLQLRLQCTGFSLQRLLLFWSTGSGVCRLQEWWSRALEHRLSSCAAWA